eukprot:CAMPEP_0172504820 /NCGR_PEP_ID=MMETSP1066-20121228/181633_1 /TAXON_ID=671091 /ORGANISM="Coscinodiscus wailesii, Strain CCMP2513" /LENGTH=292 /DNA_ID=CAMNT_0013281177 /DNA_START=83 /DNA_END=961 /DNA_ORIENTATION=+
MTSTALIIGCALIAFSPTLSLLFLLTHKKAQLTIVVTTSAFSFLLSILFSSLIHLAFPTGSAARSSPPLLLLPAIIFQTLARVGFVTVYRRVEAAVAHSIHLHERQVGDTALSESVKLRLELNDLSCGIASGVGFGLMKVMMQYGTLLASEASENMGTLYQESCPVMPSLLNSAVMACLFSLLDIVLMLLTFYGVKGRFRGDSTNAPHYSGVLSRCCSCGGVLGPDGNQAVGAVLLAHTAATVSTVANKANNGCLLALPLLACVVVGTWAYFWMKVMPYFLPGRGMEGRHQD